MRKLFVFQKDSDEGYALELECGFSRCRDEVWRVDIQDLSIDYLVSNSIDVLVSNGLPIEWYFTLKGLNIVTVTLDNAGEFRSLCDIVIDYKNSSERMYFMGQNYSIGKGDFEFEEVADLIMKLEWDSKFWGVNVAYLTARHLTDNIMSRIDKFIRTENVGLVEYLCNCHDRRSVKVAERSGFHFADMRISFEKELKDKSEYDLPPGVTFRRAGSEDIPVLKAISGDLYRDSRYFFDEGFNRSKVVEFYQGWVEKGVLGGYDDECCCLCDKGLPVGFCTLKYGVAGESARIGLLGMANGYQGRGLGKSLLNSVFNFLMDKGIRSLSVVTQGRNYTAQRLYQSSGFLTKATEIWYHKWMQEE